MKAENHKLLLEFRHLKVSWLVATGSGLEGIYDCISNQETDAKERESLLKEIEELSKVYMSLSA